MEGHFLVRLVYDDSVSFDLVAAASRVLSKYTSRTRYISIKVERMVVVIDYLVLSR